MFFPPIISLWQVVLILINNPSEWKYLFWNVSYLSSIDISSITSIVISGFYFKKQHFRGVGFFPNLLFYK